MRRFGKAGRILALRAFAAVLSGCSSQTALNRVEPLQPAAVDGASRSAAAELPSTNTARAMRIPEPDMPQPLRVADASPSSSNEPIDLLHPQTDDLMAASRNGGITASINKPATGDHGGKTSKRPAAPSDFARVNTPLSDCEREQHRQRYADSPAGKAASYCASPMDRDVRGLY